MADSSSEEKERKDGKPCPELALVHKVICNVWNLEVDLASITQLESYDDANFYLRVRSSPASVINFGNEEGEGEYLVKFYNAVDSNNMDMLNGISSLLKTVLSYNEEKKTGTGLRHPLVPHPILIPLKSTLDHGSNSTCEDLDITFVEICSRKIGVRLFRWIAGTTLNKIGKPNSATPKVIVNLGYSLGSISKSLTSFDHTAFHRKHAWDLQNFETTYNNFTQFIEEEDIRFLIDEVFQRFSKEVLINAHLFHKSVIMGDCNDANVILNNKNDVKGIIDFGDAVYTWSINEVAIAMAYVLLTEYGRLNPIECLACLFGGYIVGNNSENSLKIGFNSSEIASLHTLIAVRLCSSIAIGAYSISKEPNNEYLKLHSHPAKEALKLLFNHVSIDISTTSTDIPAVNTNSAVHDTNIHKDHLSGENLLHLFSTINTAAINLSIENITDVILTKLFVGMAKKEKHIKN